MNVLYSFLSVPKSHTSLVPHTFKKNVSFICVMKVLAIFFVVTAFLGIFTTINEHIIENAPTTRGHVGSSGIDPSLSYPLLIAILKDLETVVEVAAEHFYGDKKWNFIIVTEAMK